MLMFIKLNLLLDLSFARFEDVTPCSLVDTNVWEEGAVSIFWADYPEFGGSRFLRNVCTNIANNAASYATQSYL
jgi:hypothetical protein